MNMIARNKIGKPRGSYRERLPSSVERSVATDLFWELVARVPVLNRRLQDIVATDTWEDRAILWGFKTEMEAKQYAETYLRRQILTAGNGAAIDYLLEATGR